MRPIHNEADYKAAMREVSAFFENEPELQSPEGDRFEVLLTLVEAYETKHFLIDLPDPVEAIKFRMEQSGLTPKDLVPMIGRLNRVYGVLNRKRSLTMIWKTPQRTRHSSRKPHPTTKRIAFSLMALL